MKKMEIVVSRKNASKTNGGVFEGWGSSLCWWANRVGYSKILARKTAELFYGENGLALNIMRYNIGGGDNPSHHHITRTDSAVPGWLYWDEEMQKYRYDYTADENQLRVLRYACEAAGKDAYVEAFSNSAPWFMTESGCSSGGMDPGKDNLRKECYEEFAEYLAHVSAYIQNELHIPISSIAAMNEPNTRFWVAESVKQEGCHFEPGQSQSKILVETAKAFRKAGLTETIVSASDETSTDRQLLSCFLYSDEAWKMIDRISAHTYGNENMNLMGEYAKERGINLWMSEVDGSFFLGENAGEMGAALGLAQKIIDDMNGLSASAWVLWQLIDSHISEEGHEGNKDFGMPDVSKGYWGVAVADHDNEEIILTKKYYAFGQFSRYIRPGSQIIHCGEHALASYHPKTDEISVVIVNSEEEDVAVNIDLSDLISGEKRMKMIRTSGTMEMGENWAECGEITVENGVIKGKVKGYSITTLVG